MHLCHGLLHLHLFPLALHAPVDDLLELLLGCAGLFVQGLHIFFKGDGPGLEKARQALLLGVLGIGVHRAHINADGWPHLLEHFRRDHLFGGLLGRIHHHAGHLSHGCSALPHLSHGCSTLPHLSHGCSGGSTRRHAAGLAHSLSDVQPLGHHAGQKARLLFGRQLHFHAAGVVSHPKVKPDRRHIFAELLILGDLLIQGQRRLVPHRNDGRSAGLFRVDLAQSRITGARQVPGLGNHLIRQVFGIGAHGRWVQIGHMVCHLGRRRVHHLNGAAHFGHAFRVGHCALVVYHPPKGRDLGVHQAAHQHFVHFDLIGDQRGHFSHAPGAFLLGHPPKPGQGIKLHPLPGRLPAFFFLSLHHFFRLVYHILGTAADGHNALFVFPHIKQGCTALVLLLAVLPGIVSQQLAGVAVRPDQVNLLLGQFVFFCLPAHIPDKPPLCNDDPILALDVPACLVRKVNIGAIYDLGVEIAVVEIKIAVPGNAGVFDDGPAQLVHLQQLPLPCGVPVEHITGPGRCLVVAAVLHGRVVDCHAVHGHAGRFVLHHRLDEVVLGHHFPVTLQAVPLVPLEESVGLAHLLIKADLVVMVHALLIFLPNLGGLVTGSDFFHLRIQHQLTSFWPFPLPS